MATTSPAPATAAALEKLSSTKMFDGHNLRFRHQSATLGCAMTFSIYLPPSPASNLPVLYWLSGLTCTDENFIIKSGAQRAAAAHGIALVAPDTSPRGLNIEGEADSYDFGVGAGFYLNATNEKWKNWRMYDYIVKELPKVLSDNFEQLNTSRASIFGHSMGGHGALTVYLKNTDKYKEYDATCLIRKIKEVSAPILIDQGEDDNFLGEQLLPRNFEEACRAVGAPLILRMQPGYDHSYFFIATFIDDHIAHHAQFLKST
ncbi:hypothetical protein PR202_gb03797 [Eleusine coracana subsp. coracana]|uniref:S-formylglutathione hydrolase n=1 Tax=Eleusine coracana subsp. coracana TaxID=191504 RepID=A0AAV5E2L6_ELECO|nr:hypothetical protein PR202_gb03797 [Eleusine coracana subsp. coracana]